MVFAVFTPLGAQFCGQVVFIITSPILFFEIQEGLKEGFFFHLCIFAYNPIIGYNTTRVIGMDIKEKGFKEVDTRSIDERKRITLGKLSKSYKRMRIYMNDEGDILLKPIVEIPATEIWLYKDKKALKTVLEGIEAAKQGKVSNLKIDEL